jgi:hypothetical protein
VRRILVTFLFLAACGGSDGEGPAADAGGGADAAPPSPCNPVVGDDCVTPFPSTYYEKSASTTTGVAVAIPREVMPITISGSVIEPDRLNSHDGFSPSTPFIVYFQAGVDVTQLPTLADLADTVLATSPIQVIAADTGARVPLFAELDANAAPGDRQALLIRPQVRLRAGARYIVALVKLRDAKGQPLVVAPFASLRDGHPTAAVAGLKLKYDDIFDHLSQAGLQRADLTLAWDVIIASDAGLTSHLVAMRDAALAAADAGSLHYRVVSSKDTPDEAHRLREVQLMAEAPDYLMATDQGGLMRLDTGGQPQASGVREFPITVEIPRCAKDRAGPVPLIIFGHGLFGTAEATLPDSRILTVADDACMVLAGTDWIGLATPDLQAIVNIVLPDLNKVYYITDRLQQAHVNAQVMTRLLMTTIREDAALQVGGHAVIDPAALYYFGVSNGGVQGGTYMAISPYVARGVLNVPGCEWNLMMYRSTDFNMLYPLLDVIFPDALDRQLLIAGLQSEFDHTDPATFATHLLHDPLTPLGPKRVILQESIGDAQVTNIATRIMARTIGLSGMGLVQHVYGIPEAAGPLASAYTQWDRHITPLPPDVNIPAHDDNGAHGAIQGLPALQDQIRMFFQPDGQAVNTCGGPCDFP